MRIPPISVLKDYIVFHHGYPDKRYVKDSDLKEVIDILTQNTTSDSNEELPTIDIHQERNIVDNTTVLGPGVGICLALIEFARYKFKLRKK